MDTARHDIAMASGSSGGGLLMQSAGLGGRWAPSVRRRAVIGAIFLTLLAGSSTVEGCPRGNSRTELQLAIASITENCHRTIDGSDFKFLGIVGERKMKTMRSSILCFVVLLLAGPLLRAQDFQVSHLPLE